MRRVTTGCRRVTGPSWRGAPPRNPGSLSCAGKAHEPLRITSGEMPLLTSILSAKLVTNASILTGASKCNDNTPNGTRAVAPVVPVLLQPMSAANARHIRQFLTGVCDDSVLETRTWDCKGSKARPFAWSESRSLRQAIHCPH